MRRRPVQPLRLRALLFFLSFVFGNLFAEKDLGFQIGPVFEMFPLPILYSQASDLSSFLQLRRYYDGRSITASSLQSYASNLYDTNDFRIGNVRSNGYYLEPVMWSLGLRASIRPLSWLTAFADGVFFLGGDEKSFLQRYLLVDTASSGKYNGALRVAARDTGIGSGLFFQIGGRIQNRGLKFLQISPFAGMSLGLGALLEYKNTTHLQAILEEVVIGSSISSFSNTAALDSLDQSVTEEWTVAKSFGGLIFRGKLEAGLEYELSDAVSARLSVGLQTLGLWVSSIRRTTSVDRREYQIPDTQLMTDPSTGQIVSAVDYLGKETQATLPGFNYFQPSFVVGVGFEFRPGKIKAKVAP